MTKEPERNFLFPLYDEHGKIQIYTIFKHYKQEDLLYYYFLISEYLRRRNAAKQMLHESMQIGQYITKVPMYIPNRKIEPKDIDVTGKFLSTFGHSQSEDAARYIVMHCQEKGRWTGFTLKEMTDFCLNRNLFLWRKEFMLYILFEPLPLWDLEPNEEPTLVGGGWIIKIEDRYLVTQDFIERCFERNPAK